MQAFLDSYKIIDSFTDPKIKGIKIQHVSDVEKEIFRKLANKPETACVLWENHQPGRSGASACRSK